MIGRIRHNSQNAAADLFSRQRLFIDCVHEQEDRSCRPVKRNCLPNVVKKHLAMMVGREARVLASRV